MADEEDTVAPPKMDEAVLGPQTPNGDAAWLACAGAPKTEVDEEKAEGAAEVEVPKVCCEVEPPKTDEDVAMLVEANDDAGVPLPNTGWPPNTEDDVPAAGALPTG